MRFPSQPMNALERRTVSGLAGIFALRMLGLFLILPVFVLYAEELAGHTALLVGVAMGAYGLTQGFLQIPLGMASDRFGRKPVITAGLLLFAIGSMVAAMADSIFVMIIGRALQGAGAIAAAVIALAADLTRDRQRTKAMAVIGITIGASFIVSLLAGPVLAAYIGVRGIFWLTAAGAIGGIAVLYLWVPAPVKSVRASTPALAQLAQVVKDRQLLRLDFSIFTLHALLMALFVVVPLALVKYAHMAAAHHWQVYVPVMLVSVLAMAPFIKLSESNAYSRAIFAGAVFLLVVAQLVLWQGVTSFTGIIVGLFLFFTAFNFLEASLPSWISRKAPVESKGTAIGVYSTFEFFGAFAGGVAGGGLYGAYGMSAVFLFTAALALLWFLVALSVVPPRNLSTHTVTVGCRQPSEAQDMARRLGDLPGVSEAVVIAEEGIAYLKVDDQYFDLHELERFTTTV